ncbi:MAG: DUF4124 domain-containing protein [Pseudomonadales bacterium]
MSLLSKFLFTIGAILCHGAVAEVFKCIDESGQTSYQDTSCAGFESAQPIDRRYSNAIPLRFKEEDARIISQLADETRKLRAKRIDRRNIHIRELSNRLKEKEDQCARLKRRYNEMHVMQRRYGRSDPDAENDLVRHMREACSG